MSKTMILFQFLVVYFINLSILIKFQQILKKYHQTETGFKLYKLNKIQ